MINSVSRRDLRGELGVGTLPAGHVSLEFLCVRLFKLFFRDVVAEQNVVVIHKNVRQLFDKVFSESGIGGGFLGAVFLDDVDDLT